MLTKEEPAYNLINLEELLSASPVLNTPEEGNKNILKINGILHYGDVRHSQVNTMILKFYEKQKSLLYLETERLYNYFKIHRKNQSIL